MGSGAAVPGVVQVLQSLVVIVFAPLYAGVIAKAEAVVTSRRAPSALQRYFDLAKLLGRALMLTLASWIGSLVEPALILVFFTGGVLSASDNPCLMNHAVRASPYALVLPAHLLGTLAFSMIEEGRVLECSGRHYALMRWGSWMTFFLMSSIIMNVFLVP